MGHGVKARQVVDWRIWFTSIWRNEAYIFKETIKALVKAFARFVDGQPLPLGIHLHALQRYVKISRACASISASDNGSPVWVR